MFQFFISKYSLLNIKTVSKKVCRAFLLLSENQVSINKEYLVVYFITMVRLIKKKGKSTINF